MPQQRARLPPSRHCLISPLPFPLRARAQLLLFPFPVDSVLALASSRRLPPVEARKQPDKHETHRSESKSSARVAISRPSPPTTPAAAAAPIPPWARASATPAPRPPPPLRGGAREEGGGCGCDRASGAASSPSVPPGLIRPRRRNGTCYDLPDRNLRLVVFGK